MPISAGCIFSDGSYYYSQVIDHLLKKEWDEARMSFACAVGRFSCLTNRDKKKLFSYIENGGEMFDPEQSSGEIYSIWTIWMNMDKQRLEILKHSFQSVRDKVWEVSAIR